MGTRDEHVIDYIFRARNADTVARAADDIREGFEDIKPAAKKASDGVDDFEEKLEDWLQTSQHVAASGGPFAGIDPRIAGAVGAGFVVATAAVSAFRGSLDKLNEAWDFTIDKAAAQEESVIRVEQAMRSAGTFSVQASRDFQEFASAMQEVTASGDEETLALGALIAQIGRLRGDQLERATVAALDMQAALGKTSQEVGIFLGKLAQGEAGSLTEIGIVIDQTLPKSEKFLAGLEAIEAAFGGTAQATVKSYAGATTQLANAWGDLGESIGELALPALTRFAQQGTLLVSSITEAIRGFTETGQATVPELARTFDIQLAAIRGSVGATRRELEEGLGVISEDAVRTLRLEIKSGELDQVVETLAELDAVIANATRGGNKAFQAMVESMRDAVEEEFRIRIQLEASQAGAELANLSSSLAPELSLDVLLRGSDAFHDAVRLSEGAREEIERPLLFGGGVIEGPDLEALRQEAVAAETALRELQAEFTPQNPVHARELDINIQKAEQKLAQLQEEYEKARAKLAADIEGGNVTFTVGPVQNLEEQAREFTEQLGPHLEREGLEVVAQAKVRVEAAESTDELRAFLQDLEKRFQEATSKAFQEPSDRNEAVRDALRQANEVAKAAAVLRGELLKAAEEADAVAAATDRMVSLFVGLQSLTVATPLDAINIEDTVRGITDATEATELLDKAMRDLRTSNDITELSAAYTALGAAVKASDDDVHALDDDMRQMFLDAQAELLVLIGLLDDAERERLIQLRIDAKQGKKDAKESGDDIAKILGDRIGNFSMDGPTLIADSFFDAFVNGSERAFLAAEDAFRNMVDAMIAELLRLAALQIFRWLVGISTGGSSELAGAILANPASVRFKPDDVGINLGGPPPGPPTGQDGFPAVRQFVGEVARPLEEVANQIALQQQLFLAAQPELVKQSAAAAALPFLGDRERGVVQNIEVRAIDSADVERWFRDGAGSRALRALAATGRF
jgi:hypothetical protein